MSLIRITYFVLLAALAVLAAASFAHAGDRPARIVSLGPNLTQAAIALGAGGDLVGVSDYCPLPPAGIASEPPERVGGLLNPNLERITRLQPDLVLVQGDNPKVEDYCRLADIPCFTTRMDSLQTIYSGLADLGRALARGPAAEALVASIRADLEQLEAALSTAAPVDVFLCVGRPLGSFSQLTAAGPSSFLSQLVELAGGRNVFADLSQPYPAVSKESLLARRPDIILEFRPGEEDTDGLRRRVRQDWAALHPDFAGRVRVLTEDSVVIPGPYVADAARTLARALHPTIMAELCP